MPDRTSSMPPESDVLAGPHASPADHGEGHGHDDHAHAGEAIALGPIDVDAWGAAALGIAAGLAVALVLARSNL